jgi:glycosyltransferase involved in cell wall biosynthesis
VGGSSDLTGMAVLWLWSAVSGYMAACWRALARTGRARFAVVAAPNNNATAFDPEIMEGIEWVRRPQGFLDRVRLVRGLIESRKPSAVVLGGWADRAYLVALAGKAARDPAIVLCMDTPWLGTGRQQIGRLAVRFALPRIDAVVVPGERAAQYAMRLGLGAPVHTPLYGIELEPLERAGGTRHAAAWPRAFLFLGRYVREKGLEVLLEAYARYRADVENPWPLLTCGKGPLEGLLAGTEGVKNLGFKQPNELPDILAKAGIFVLPSLIDHWGVALAEACGAGLPVIATSACGSTVECVRDGWNGFIVPAGDPLALSRALVRAHEAHARLPEMGRRSLEFARPYGASAWAERWVEIFESAVGRRRGPLEDGCRARPNETWRMG